MSRKKGKSTLQIAIVFVLLFFLLSTAASSLIALFSQTTLVLPDATENYESYGLTGDYITWASLSWELLESTGVVLTWN